MLFNSIGFLAFFVVVVCLYFLLPPKRRWILLLVASYYFYMSWNPRFIALILGSTLIDYFASHRMVAKDEPEKRRPYLYLSIAANLGLLFFFKYFNFFNDSAADIATALELTYPIPLIDIVLPVGISFYTFQTMSYSIDVYQGRIKPESHLGVFALYVAYFPQLVAGPIERASRLLPQLHSHHRFNYDRMTSGLKLMAWGMFKKVMIADRVAVAVNQVYNQPYEYEGISMFLATLLFAIQIYCDFSGYSDIAIGAARVMGVDLMKNFLSPYYSRSISEFWKRWHISLSTWFRDYVYIPLGGNRVIKWRWYYNLLVTFLVSGLWHGANWTFIIWGGLHGLYLVIETIVYKDDIKGFHVPFSSVSGTVRMLITFILVLFAWIFFRANSVSEALHIASHIGFDPIELISIKNLIWEFEKIGLGGRELIIAALAIIAMEVVHYLQLHGNLELRVKNKPGWIRYPAYIGLVASMVYFGAYEQTSEFIYFQF